MPAAAFDCACALKMRGEGDWGYGAGGFLFEDKACEQEAPREEVEAACVDEAIFESALPRKIELKVYTNRNHTKAPTTHHHSLPNRARFHSFSFSSGVFSSPFFATATFFAASSASLIAFARAYCAAMEL